MDIETLSRQLNDVKQSLHDKDVALQTAILANQQLTEENQSIAAQLESVIHENTAKIEQLEQDRYSLNLRLVQQTKMSESYLEEIESIKCQMSSDRQSIVARLQDETEEKLAKFKKQVVSLRSDLELSQQSTTQLSEKVMEQEDLIRQLQAENEARKTFVFSDSSNEELDSISEQLKSTIVEKIALGQECQDLRVTVERLKSKVESLNRQLAGKDREIEESERQATSYYNTLERTREEVQELKMELELAKMDANSSKKKGNSLFSEVEDKRVAAEKMLISFQVQNESLKRQLELSRQNLHMLKMQVASLLQMTGVKADARHLESVSQQLSQATSEIQTLTRQLHTSQQEARSLKDQLLHVTTPGDNDSNHVLYLQALMQRKESELEAVQKDLQTRRLLMLAETEKLVDLERRLYASEQQLGAMRSVNARLQLRLDELLMKYEPDTVVTGTRRKVKVEKIPILGSSDDSVVTHESGKENVIPVTDAENVTVILPTEEIVDSQSSTMEKLSEKPQNGLPASEALPLPLPELPLPELKDFPGKVLPESRTLENPNASSIPVASSIPTNKVIAGDTKLVAAEDVGIGEPGRVTSAEVKVQAHIGNGDKGKSLSGHDTKPQVIDDRNLSGRVMAGSATQNVVVVPPADQGCKTQ